MGGCRHGVGSGLETLDVGGADIFAGVQQDGVPGAGQCEQPQRPG